MRTHAKPSAPSAERLSIRPGRARSPAAGGWPHARPSSPPGRYAAAIGFLAAAVLIDRLLFDAPDMSVWVWLPAISAAAWFGGFGPGVLVAALSVLWRLHPLAQAPRGPDAGDLPGALALFAAGLACSHVANRLWLAQAVLRARRAADALALRLVADAVIVAGGEGQVIDMNDAAMRLDAAPDALSRHLHAIARAGPGTPDAGDSRSIELERVDGRRIALSATSTRFDGPALGSGVVVVLRDPSLRARPSPPPDVASPAPPLQAILDASHARIFHLGRDLRLIWCNRALREHHRLRGDCTGATLETLFEPQKRSALMRPLQRALQGGSEVLEWRAFDARGVPCWTSTMITPDVDENGQIVGCIVLSIDVTARHHADAIRRRSEDQRRGVMESLPDLVWVTAADGSPEWFNHRWADYTGRSVADWRDPVHADDRPRVDASWSLALARGHALTMEARLVRHDGTSRWHLVRMQPLRESVTEPGIWGWCGSCTDIDDQKRAATLQRTTQQRISTFLGTLSHELRNPLAALSAAIQVMRHPHATSGMNARALDTLDRQSTLLARLVDELLDATRLMDGHIDLQRRRVALNEVLREVCEDLSARAGEAGVHLHCEIPERTLFVDADLLRIKQAVENLVVNAIEACAAGERVTVCVVEGHPGEAGIRVADTGCGLTPESLASLFDPGSAPRREKTPGLGLGLKTVNRILQLHGGRVVAASDGPGKGATFDLFFPVFDAAATAGTRDADPGDSTALAGHRVLIVSSHGAQDVDTVRDGLEQQGAEVCRVAHGFAGLRAAQEWRPTSVVCDLDLPTPLSGYDVVRQALTLALEPRPRLVAIGSGDPDESARARAAGFDECLGRPLTVPGLLDALRRRDASSR